MKPVSHLPGTLVTAHLEQRCPARNRQRFYRIELGVDLFGGWCLRRIWGRIGTGGRARIDRFASRAQARAARAALIAQKRRRGYVLLPLRAGRP